MSTSAIMSLDGRSVVWEPLNKQRLAMAAPADEVFYGGTKGSAKSDLLVMRPAPVLQLAHRKYLETGRRQRCSMVIFRKTLSQEARDIIDRTKIMYPLLDPQMGIRGWHEQAKRWDFTSGATVTFAHMDNPDDYRRWQGVEVVGFGIDEAPEYLPYDVYKFLSANNRSTDPDYAAAKWILLTGNPGGMYADWIHKYFIAQHPEGSELIDEEIKVKGGEKTITRSRVFIKARLEDNPYYYNSGEYEANLRTLPEHMQRWYLHGDWSASMGGYFAGLWQPDIHVIDPFSIPRSWEVGMGIDWGEDSPACAEVAARDQDNNVYFIDELYEPGVTGSQFGQRMLEKLFTKAQNWSIDRHWSPRDVPGFIDPSASRVHSKDDGSNVSDAIAACGFSVFAANNNRVSGWRQMRERMLRRKNGRPDKAGKPKIFVFRGRCPRLEEQIARIMPDKAKPGDVNTKQVDHALDAARYRLMEWPLELHDETEPEDAVERAWLRIHESRPTGPAGDDDDYMTTGYGD